MESLMDEVLDVAELSFSYEPPLTPRDVSAAEPRDAVQTFSPGPTPDTVRTTDGDVLGLPQGWVLLPPGDPTLIRRVKAAGDHWLIWEKKGRKVTSRGVCAAAAAIDRIRTDSKPSEPGSVLRAILDICDLRPVLSLIHSCAVNKDLQ